MIIGVTGFFCSGKDTLAEILADKGFAHISLSDMIRDELRNRKQKVSITSLTKVGNKLRREKGQGILAERALEQIDFSRNWVVTSIRHPLEVEVLRSRPDFLMVFVDAPQKVRFERSLARARKGDPLTLDEFISAEEQQMHPESGDPASQALALCRKQADIQLLNDTGLEDFRQKVISLAGEHLFKHFLPRPSWDEYFMMMAVVAATRSNCIKRRVGAVIVHNKQILSTGYNGTPKGITNCSEGGCPRCAGVADSGSNLGECLCVHAEENAIVQAAAHGVAIRNGTLYCTLCPCSYCAKSIINSGIVEVVYSGVYAMDIVTEKLFREAGIHFRKMDDPTVTVRLRFSHPAEHPKKKKT
jgi:dCMP deaminase